MTFNPFISDWQLVSIGSGNGLAPDRRQAITWINVDRDVHVASPGHNVSFQGSEISEKLLNLKNGDPGLKKPTNFLVLSPNHGKVQEF